MAWDCPCNSYCNYQSGMCTQGAEGTCSYQACVQETFGCHDSMCLGPSRGSDFLSAETTKKPAEAPTCTPTKGGDAD